MNFLSTPIDIAYEHCLWSKRAGLTPADVLRSVGAAFDVRRGVGWPDALDTVRISEIQRRNMRAAA